MSREIAILRKGVVVNVANTTKSMDELRASMEGLCDMRDIELIPIEQVPEGILRNYQYWTERP